MTKEQIEKLMEGATKGPWEAVRKSVRVLGSGDEFGAPTGGAGGICNTLGAGYGGSKSDPVNVQAERNACFIAALPDIAQTALDALQRVEELTNELEIANQGIDKADAIAYEQGKADGYNEGYREGLNDGRPLHPMY